MKKIETETGYMYLGTAREICSLFRNLEKRYLAASIYSDDPKFNMNKFYALELDYENLFADYPQMTVISGDTALAIIFNLYS